MPDIPADAQAIIQGHLTAIARIFKTSRITLVVRAADDGNAKGDLVLTNDDPYLAECALKAEVIRRAQIFAGTPMKMEILEKEKTDGESGPHLFSGGPASGYQPRGRRRG